MITIRDCSAKNCGSDGLRIGSGVNVNVTGFKAHGNGGRGAYIAADANATLVNVSAKGNAAGGIVIGGTEDSEPKQKSKKGFLGTTATWAITSLSVSADLKSVWPSLFGK